MNPEGAESAKVIRDQMLYSRRVALAAVGIALLFVASFGFLYLVGQGETSDCRDLVEDRYFATIGTAIGEAGTVGTVSEDTLADLAERTERVERITETCPSVFIWTPWTDLGPPPLSEEP